MSTELGTSKALNTEEIKALHDAHVINTYGTRRLALTKGEGCTLWDADGNEYLDAFAGIATANLGHCHPAVTGAIAEQAATLVHVSNLYYIQQQGELAAKLSELSFADRWFFANCGATANEAAIKLARRYWAQQGTPKPLILTMKDSFHGRTMATITATGQPKYHEGFEPMLPGIAYVPFDNVAALEAAITPEVGAVMLEAIQGEGGVRVPAPDYLERVRKVCDKHNILMIIDEVQTGMGRTGKLFAYQHSTVAPDIMTLAKALGNGIPIGAMGCTEKVASGFSVGSHASTFGGNPLCTAAALATIDTLTQPGFLDGAAEKGAYFMDKLEGLSAKHDAIVEVRGKGLMIGVELNVPAAPVVSGMIDAGVICGAAGPQILRFVPALVITSEQIDRVVSTLDQVLKAM